MNELVDDASYLEFQKELLEMPARGDVMQSLGGLMKVRIASLMTKQERQCSRYLPVPEAARRDHPILPVHQGEERTPDRSPAEVPEDGGGGY